jgi:hypothetical protein
VACPNAKGERSRPLEFLHLVACLALAGCFSVGSVSESKFLKKHGDCDEVDTIKDSTGRVHVRGCGHVEIYDCTVESTPTIYKDERRTVTTCEEVDQGEKRSPDVQAWLLSRRPQAAPPVEVRREKGRTLLQLELVLNRTALLRLTASPSEHPDQIALRLSRREPDASQDACPLQFHIDDQPANLPTPAAKRADEMLSQQLQLEGQQLARFDGISKLSMTACNHRWSLTRAQILRVRELMTKLRKESPPVAASTPAP